MTLIDITLLVVLGGFILAGFWFGVIHMVGTIVGILLGALISGQTYEYVATLIAPHVGDNLNLARVIAFMAIFALINKLVGVLFQLIEKAFKIATIIPFLKTFNRLLGAALGLIEGTLVLGILVYFAGKFPITDAFQEMLQNSFVAKGLNLIGLLLAPLLPQAVRALKSIF